MAILGFLINFSVWSTWFFLAARAVTNVKRLNKFICFTAFFIPFYSISFGILNFQFSIYKLLPIVLIIFYFFRFQNVNMYLLAFLVYGVIISFISYLLLYYGNGFEFAINYGRSTLSAYLAPILQGIIFLTFFCQLFTASKHIEIDTDKALVYFLYGCVTLTAIGYLQFCFYFLNMPWFDFWFLGDALGRSIEGGLNSHAMDRGFYRMSSLGGEPRHFGATIVLGILTLQYLYYVRHEFPTKINKYRGIIFCFLLSGMILSLSASALLAFTIVILIFYALTNKLYLVISVSFITFLFFIFRSNEFVDTLLWKLASLDMIIYAAKKDGFALRAIFHSAYYFIFGYGNNLADLVVPDYYLIQKTPFGIINRYEDVDPMSSSIVPTSAILMIMTNFGLIGFILFLLSIISYLNGTRNGTKVFAVSLLGCVCVSSFLIFPIGIFLLALIINRDRITNKF